MHFFLAAILLIVALLMIAKPAMFESQGEPELPGFSFYILFGLVLFALQLALHNLPRTAQRMMYRLLGVVTLVGAVALAAFGHSITLELKSGRRGGFGIAASSGSFTDEVIAMVQKERPSYIVWESAIQRVEVIDPARKIAVSYTMVAYINDHWTPDDVRGKILFDVEKDLNARYGFLGSSGELEAKQAEIAKVIEKNNLKAPGVIAPPTVVAALEEPPKLSEEQALKEVDECLARADVAWKSGDKATSILEASTAMGICRMHLGDNHQRTKQVAAMVSAASRN